MTGEAAETIVTDALRFALGDVDLDMRTGFVAAGGDSISAIEVSDYLADTTGTTIDPESILYVESLRSLVDLVARSA